MIGSEIITQFEMQTDDTTELSSTEELTVLNRVYRKILNDRPWEFLKKAFTGTIGSDGTVALPDDFKYVIQNGNYTDASYIAVRPVVFVGSNYAAYQVVSWSDRRQYRDQDGYCYVDIVNSNLVFTTTTQAGAAIEYDYIYNPDDVAIDTSPVFPSRFHDILVYGMQVDDNIIQQSDKAKSYAGENQNKYKSVFDDLTYWNAQLIQQ